MLMKLRFQMNWNKPNNSIKTYLNVNMYINKVLSEILIKYYQVIISNYKEGKN